MGDWEKLPAMENCVFSHCDEAFKECVDALEQYQTSKRRRTQNMSPPASSPL
jgi:hypothetical protein